MNLIMSVYVAVLFFVLTPGVLLRLPPKGSLIVVAATHAVVFALIYQMTRSMVYRLSMEGFDTCDSSCRGTDNLCLGCTCKSDKECATGNCAADALTGTGMCRRKLE